MPPALQTTSRSQCAPVFGETNYRVERPETQPPTASGCHPHRKRLRRTAACRTTCFMPELKDFASSVAIVVSSCDAFFDTWRPFVFFFRQHWGDYPFARF